MSFNLAIIEDEREYATNVGEYFQFKGAKVVASVDSVSKFCTLNFEDENKPHIILLDNNLADNEYGVENLEKLKKKAPTADIVVLTSHDDSKFIFSAICNGAIGYLIKGMPIADIYKSVEDVLNGGSVMSPSIARKVFNYFSANNRKDPRLDELTSREMEIAEAIRDGLSYKMIGEKLFISIETVRYHVKNIYRKLHVNSKSEVVSVFYKS